MIRLAAVLPRSRVEYTMFQKCDACVWNNDSLPNRDRDGATNGDDISRPIRLKRGRRFLLDFRVRTTTRTEVTNPLGPRSIYRRGWDCGCVRSSLLIDPCRNRRRLSGPCPSIHQVKMATVPFASIRVDEIARERLSPLHRRLSQWHRYERLVPQLVSPKWGRTGGVKWIQPLPPPK